MTTLNIVTPCAQNVAQAQNVNGRAAPVSTSGGGGGTTNVNVNDLEYVPMIDNRNGTRVPYMMKVVRNSGTGAETISRVAMDGTTAFAPTGTQEHPGQSSSVPTSAAEMVTPPGYTGTIGPGTYDKAAILNLFANPKPTKLLTYTFTVASGTATINQDGTATNLPTSSIVQRDYLIGFEVDQFSLTVNAGSSVYVQARGV